MKCTSLALAAGLLSLAAAAGNTADGAKLLFETATGAVLADADLAGPGNTDYGDAITATSQNGFGYALDQGQTPHITASYSFVHPYPTGYGSMTNVLYRHGYSSQSDFLEITLTADTGYKVLLHSFDMAGWTGFGQGVKTLEVRDQANNVLYTQTDPTIAHTTGVTTFPFNTALEGTSLTIRFTDDVGNEGLSGIDNVVFSEALVPEPSAASAGLVVGIGIVLGGARRWRN